MAAAAAAASLVLPAYGQDDCVRLIELSTVTQSSVGSSSDFKKQVTNFCDEHERSKDEQRSANYGGAYKFLSVSMGNARRSAENVASKYCRYEGDQRNSVSAYEDYLKGIDSRAFDAYDACLRADKSGVAYKLEQSSQNRLLVTARVTSSIPGGSARLSYYASDPVVCKWKDNDDSKDTSVVDVQTGLTTVLDCRRDDPRVEPHAERDWVSVIGHHDHGETLNIPWRKFDELGHPYQTLEEIRQELEDRVTEGLEQVRALENRINTLTLESSPAFGKLNPGSESRFKWRSGRPPIRMIEERDGICFLTLVEG